MRIAVFHELAFGGARRAVFEISSRLNRKHTLDLYFIDGKDDKTIKGIFRKIYFYNFTPKVWKGNNWKSRLYKDTIELFNLYKLHKKIADDINSRGYDFAFVNPSRFTHTPFILRFLSLPKIYFCQEPLRIVYDPFISDLGNLGFGKKIYETFNRKVRKIIDSTNLKAADLILSNSLFSKKWIKDSYGINSSVCHLGVDYKKFRPLKIKRKYDLLFFGRKDRAGGYDLLNDTINLFKIKPKIKILIKDDPAEKNRISDWDLAKEYNQAKMILMLGKNEPFTLIPLEAMACETPIIAINQGCLGEIVKNGENGFLTEESPEELFVKINKLLNNDGLRLKMGIKGREDILSNWTWEKSVNNIEKLFKKVI